jgi:hypothetical protein
LQRNYILWKGLAVGIILLFVGVAVSPSITAPTPTSKTIQFDVQLCGLNKNYTVQLTPEQTKEVYRVFDDIKQKMSTVTTRVETKEIFTEAINALWAIGLLKGISISQAKELILQSKKDTKLIDVMKVLSNKQQNLSIPGNYLCSIAGNTSNTYFSTAFIQMTNALIYLPFFVFNKISTKVIKSISTIVKFLTTFIQKIIEKLPFTLINAFLSIFDPMIEIVLSIILLLLTYSPNIVLSILTAVYNLLSAIINLGARVINSLGLLVGNIIFLLEGATTLPWIFMNYYTEQNFRDPQHCRILIGDDRWGAASGWVDTVGENGNIYWNGSLWGQLPLIPYLISIMFSVDNIARWYFYPGVVGFKGISVWSNERQDWSYLGNALWVNIGLEHPENPWMLASFP